MKNFELKVTMKDWIYITIIAIFFGFLISLVFYFLNQDLQRVSTILFSISSAAIISIFSSVLITVSNNLILPRVNKQFWYFISFVFSFASGALGFLFSFLIFSYFDI